MAGNPILKAQKLPEQILAIHREIRKIRTTLRPANRRRQRHRQHFQQIVTARVARSRIAKIIKRRGKPGHGYPPYYEGHPKNPYQLIALLYFSNAIPLKKLRSAIRRVRKSQRSGPKPPVRSATSRRDRASPGGGNAPCRPCVPNPRSSSRDRHRAAPHPRPAAHGRE